MPWATPHFVKGISLPLFLREPPKTPLMLEWHGYGVTDHLPDRLVNLHYHPAKYDARLCVLTIECTSVACSSNTAGD
jgi:hypothetical protein